MSDLQIQGEVVVSSEKAEAAFDRVGDKAERMASDVAKSANEAGKAVDGIGGGAEKSAEKFTRAEARIRDSIKKSTQELQLLGKTASEKLEFKIADRGLDASKFAPYIAELKKAEAAQRDATTGLNAMGMSAKQTAAALRQVPMQFTDIVVSLQGGQSAMQVFLQQGGQLKDMFGGAGAAARALGGYVMGLVNPLTLLAATAAGIAVAYNQGSKESDAFVRSIVTTGNASGVTTSQLRDYARAIDSVVGTQAQAAEGLAAFVAAGVRGGDELRRYTQTAIEWEKATGQAVSKTADQFASLQKDPLTAVLKLNEGTNFLTTSIYEQIKALTEQGRSADASKIAMDALDTAMRERSKAIEANLGYIERGWNAVKNAAKEAWDAMLSVGRRSTLGDQLSAAEKELENRQAKSGTVGNDAAWQAGNARLRARIDYLKDLIGKEEASAKAQADSGRQMESNRKWEEGGLRFLSDSEKLTRELTKARNEGVAAGKTQAEIETRLQQIRDSYNKKTGGGASAENKELRDRQRIYAELVGVSSTYYSELENYQKQRAAGVVTEEQYVAAVEKLIAKQPFATELAKESAKAAKEEAAALNEAAQQRYKAAQAAEQSVNGLMAGNQQLRDEIQLIGLSATEQMEVLRLREESVLLVKEQHLAEMKRAEDMTGTMTRERIALEQEIELRRERLNLMGDKATKEQFAESNREMTSEWRRTVDQYGDVFRKGFADMLNNGKDGWKSFTRSLVTTFKTTVADQIYKMFAQPFVVNIVGSLLGVTGGVGGAAVQAASGGSSILGMASNASSLYSLATSNSMVGNAVSTVGGWLGLGASTTGLGLTAGAGAGAIGAGIGSSLGLGAAGSAATGLGAAGSAATGLGLTAGGGLGITAGSAGASAIGAGIGTSAAAGGAAAGGAAAGSGGIAGALSAIPGWGWALAGAAVVLGSVLGRKVEKRGQGIMGVLGEEGGVHDLDLMRKGGSIVGGPKWFVRDMGVSDMDKALQETYKQQRDALIDMGKALGLATDGVENFTVQLGSDELGDKKVRGIRLDGLSDEEAQKKIAEALATANNEIAQQIIGTWERTVREVERIDISSPTDVGDTTDYGVPNVIRESIVDERYIPSEFARDGEQAIDTLTRLATSLTGVNTAFENLGVTLYEASLAGGDMASQLVDLFGGMGQFSQATGVYMQNFYSAEEQRDVVRRQLERAFEGLELKLPDIDASDAREQFRAIAEAQDLTTEAGRRAWSVLVQLSGAFAGVTQSAQDAAEAAQRLAEQQVQQSFTAVDDAYAALQRSVDARRAIVRETIDSTRAVFTTLRDNVRALYGEVGSTSLMQAAQGRAFIDQALVAAKTTGYLPDGDQLAEAINAVRAGMDGTAYASQFDADRDRLILAGKLNDLKAISGDQLTEAERQLRALDGILDSSMAQIDALKGIDSSVKSVESAIKALEAALLSANQLKQQQQQQAMANLSGGVYHGNGTVTTGSGATVPVSEFVGKTDSTRAAAYLASNPDVAAAYASGNTYGMTPAEFATVHYALYGLSEGRKFAKGGYYPGGVALVGEQGPELINFRNPGQVYTAAQTANLLGGGNTQRLEALVERLIDDNRRQAGEIARLNARMARVMEKWDGDGMPGARMEAAV